MEPTGGMKRSNTVLHIKIPRRSVELPEDVLFLIFDLFENLKVVPCVCIKWNHAYKCYRIEGVNQKKPLLKEYFPMLSEFGGRLRLLDLKTFSSLNNDTLLGLFANCKNVQEVILSSNLLNNHAFVEAQTLTCLRSLSLDCKNLTHTIFKVLPPLQTLNISTHKIISLKHLTKLAKLTALNMTLSVSYCNEEEFQPITKLNALKVLNLIFDREVSNRRRELIPTLSNNENYLTRLTGLFGLERLILHCRDFELTENGLTDHLISFTTLKTLQLEGWPKAYHGFDPSVLSQLTYLHTLSLHKFKFYENGDGNLTNLRKLPFLRGLELTYFCVFGQNGYLRQSLQGLTNLKNLKLKGVNCMHVKVHDISELELPELQNVEFLEASQNFNPFF